MTRRKIILKMPNLVSTQLLERTKYKTPLRLSCLGFCFDADPTYDVLKVTAKSPYSKARHNPDAAYFCNARKAIYMLLWPLSITSLKTKRPTGQGTNPNFFKASDKVASVHLSC
jgi:hypothetical protein